jgi:Effector-associated domain 11
MIAVYDTYCTPGASTPLKRAFLAYIRNDYQLSIEAIKSTTPEQESSYQRACAIGYLSALSGEFLGEFTNAVGVLSGRKFYPRDSIVDDNLALLGCYLGLSVSGQSIESQWFHNLLEIKQSLGGTHTDFCDAIAGKCPKKGHSMIELYLFLRQRISAVPIVDTTLREWMLEHWRKPIPYYNDFFRDVIALNVMENGMDMVLRNLERLSAKFPISHNDLKKLRSAKDQVERANINSAFAQVKEVLDHYDGQNLNADWLSLKTRWEMLKKSKEFQGTIPAEEARIEENRIIHGLSCLIDAVIGETI